MKKFTARYLPIVMSTLILLALTLAVTVQAAEGEGIKSPLRDEVSSIPGFIEAALKALVLIALPILTLFIVYSGFKFISAQGNSSKLEEAKKNFMYVIIGSLLILGAWVVATLVGGTVNQLTG